MPLRPCLKALNPSILTLTIEKVLCDGLRTMSGTTMATNCLMDMLEGKELMEAFGWFQTYVGAVVLTMYVNKVVRLFIFISGRYQNQKPPQKQHG